MERTFSNAGLRAVAAISEALGVAVGGAGQPPPRPSPPAPGSQEEPMRSIWVAIHARGETTRVLAMDGPAETILKARLMPRAQHPRALPALLEAIAMWQGRRVRAAVVDDAAARSAPGSLYHDAWEHYGPTPLYSLEVVGSARPPRPRDGLDGMGDYRDLRRLLRLEVAR